jgi:cytochrome c
MPLLKVLGKKMIKFKQVISMAILPIVLSGFSVQSVAAEDGAALWKNPSKGGCKACHGADGKTPLMGLYPKLAGNNADYLFAQMKDIKSGARNNGQTAAMKGVMGMVNEAEMKALAQYLSTLK